MSEFEVYSRFTSEGSDAYIRGDCKISGSLITKDGRDAAQIEFEITHNEDKRPLLIRFLFSTNKSGDLEIELPTVRDPMIDYAFCVAGRLASSVARAGYECHRTTDSWLRFLDCMKSKAHGLGMNALWSLFLCLTKLFPN